MAFKLSKKMSMLALAWHPFHEEYFVSGSFDGSIFHWLVGHETPQIEIQNAHDGGVWDLAWHPIGYLLCSGSSDNTTKFWCRNRPGDPARDKLNTGQNQGYNEQNSAFAGRMPVNIPGPEPPTTPGPFAGMSRNEGTIPGIGVAMPLSLDTSTQGEQKQAISSSMPIGAPPLPPGPHPSLFAANQQQQYQQNPQQPHHHHQMTPLQPPNMQHPSHMPLLPHPHLPRPPPQLPPHNMPSSMPGSMPMHGQMGPMNQMGPPMQQGHFMGMNPMHSGPGGPPPGSMPNMQGPSSAGGNQMYSPGGAFNRPQGAQIPPMPGLGPYQPGNPSGGAMGTVPPNFGMPSGIPPPLPPGPPPHGQTPQ